MAVSGFAIANLGISFGLVPANRGIKTTGLYSLARHPIYGLYFIHDAARILMGPTPRNMAVFLAVFVLEYKRSTYEEQHLASDPAYRAYAQRVKWRFVPGLG